MDVLPVPTLRLVCSLELDVGPAVETGPMGPASRRVVPILGGRVDGPLFSGVVLPGGSDVQSVRPDGVTEIHAKYVLQTTTGMHVFVEHRALRYLVDPGDPASMYFRGFMRLASDGASLAHLDRREFLTTGARVDGHPYLDVYEVH